MRPAPERILPGGIRVIAAFEHAGPARVLVHHLKYRGLTSYAELVADLLAPRIPQLPVVAVPRAVSRRLRYGVDPAVAIARALASRKGVRFIAALRAPIHSPRRAGGDHTRPVTAMRKSSLRAPLVVLVDDVVTTGATLSEAIRVLGAQRVALAAAANAAPGSSMVSPSESAPL